MQGKRGYSYAEHIEYLQKLKEGVWGEVASPLGNIRLVVSSSGVSELHLPGSREKEMDFGRDDSALSLLVEDLDRYFKRELRIFEWPLVLEGTEFQLSVWNALRTIPYGEVRSYGDIASQIGKPKAVRAVGGANGANPIAIVIPCHRVIRKNGEIGGFSARDDIKSYLLELEGVGESAFR